MSDTLIALAKSHGLEYEVHECLSKAVEFEPKDPVDPYLAQLLRLFRREHAEAAVWIRALVGRVVSGEAVRTSSFSSKLAKAYHLVKARAERIDGDGPLTKEQIRYLQDAIRERFNYIAKNLESDFTPDDNLLKKWKALGIIDQAVTAKDFASMSEGKLIRNAFVFGRLHSAIEHGHQNYDEILKFVIDAPLTRADTFAIEAAERSAARYITKFGEDIAGEAGRLADAKNRQIVHDMVVNTHKQELHALKFRPDAPDRIVTDWNQLSSELYHTMGDKARDWDRIGFYELNQSKKEGEAMALLAKYGKEKLVYKLPLATACPQCLYLYQDEKGIPRLFRLGVMLGFGSNVGRKPLRVKGGKVIDDGSVMKSETYKPIAGLVHPWCECSGPFPATGYEHWFDQAAQPK
jgi:hypothetical protein